MITVKDNLGRNGFQIAKNYGARKVVELIMEKFPSIAEETTEQHYANADNAANDTSTDEDDEQEEESDSDQ